MNAADRETGAEDVIDGLVERLARGREVIIELSAGGARATYDTKPSSAARSDRAGSAKEFGDSGLG